MGYHWYVVRELGRPDPDTFLDTYGRVAAWLDDLPAVTGVSLDATVVGGFSQGAVMSYALALGKDRPSPAGLIALNGFIPEAPGFTLDLPGHKDVLAAISHGAWDEVIPVEFGRAAARRLRAAGLEVVYSESLMPHAVDPVFVRELAELLPEIVRRRMAA